MYPVYACKTVEDTPFMRKWIPRLCVENSRDSRLDVDSAGELRQLFGLGFGGVVGGKAAIPNVKNPRQRMPTRAC
jgi:hypothetical protein